jgi:hypothetical protein
MSRPQLPRRAIDHGTNGRGEAHQGRVIGAGMWTTLNEGERNEQNRSMRETRLDCPTR